MPVTAASLARFSNINGQLYLFLQKGGIIELTAYVDRETNSPFLEKQPTNKAPSFLFYKKGNYTIARYADHYPFVLYYNERLKKVKVNAKKTEKLGASYSRLLLGRWANAACGKYTSSLFIDLKVPKNC